MVRVPTIYDLGVGAVAVVAALWMAMALAATGPQPPCNAPPEPPYAEISAPANLQVWSWDDSDDDWRPPDCTGWAGQKLQTVVAVTGRFRSSPDALLQRFAAISGLTGIRYWSVTRHAWRDLVDEAYALEGPEADRRRPDFTTAELQPGRDLYFYQDDNGPAGGAVYRLRVRERSPDRLVLETKNVAPVRLLLLPLFEAGVLRALYFLRQEAIDVWSYYGLTATAAGASRLLEGHTGSLVNRAVAIYRHAAGITADESFPPSAAHD